MGFASDKACSANGPSSTTMPSGAVSQGEVARRKRHAAASSRGWQPDPCNWLNALSCVRKAGVCPPKARVNPVCVEKKLERDLKFKDLRDQCRSLHTRK